LQVRCFVEISSIILQNHHFKVSLRIVKTDLLWVVKYLASGLWVDGLVGLVNDIIGLRHQEMRS